MCGCVSLVHILGRPASAVSVVVTLGRRRDDPIDTYLLLDRSTSEVFNQIGGCSAVLSGMARTWRSGFEHDQAEYWCSRSNGARAERHRRGGVLRPPAAPGSK